MYISKVCSMEVSTELTQKRAQTRVHNYQESCLQKHMSKISSPTIQLVEKKTKKTASGKVQVYHDDTEPPPASLAPWHTITSDTQLN